MSKPKVDDIIALVSVKNYTGYMPEGYASTGSTNLADSATRKILDTYKESMHLLKTHTKNMSQKMPSHPTFNYCLLQTATEKAN